MERRSVLVTGGNGYLGSVLVEELKRRGYRVVVFDNCLTSQTFPPGLSYHNVSYVDGDIREASGLEQALRGIDSVVHLASIVGDPACGANPDLAWETNYLGTINVAKACRKVGVRRMVFASTCSNYGFNTGGDVDELAPLNPQSIYAQTKIQSEHYLLSIRDDHFSPCILRFATLYGLSPRMRFDLAVNVMTIKAALEKEVTVYGGEQWRPFLHIADAASAIIKVLEPLSSSHSAEIFNCGSEMENYQLKELGQMIVDEVQGARLSIVPEVVDNRSYRIDFGSIQRVLNFTCQRRVIDGVREILEAAQQGLYHDYNLPKYSNHALVLNHIRNVPVLATL